MLDLRLGDCLEVLRGMPDNSVHCCVTSPPYYGLRDYGMDGQIGLEPTPDQYVARMVTVFREVRRVLRDDGTCWVNLGDSYSSGAVSNLTDFVSRQLKCGVLFFGCADPRGCTTKRIHILVQDKSTPDDVLLPFFTAERVLVKNGQHNLCEIGGRLDAPVSCWVSRSLWSSIPNDSDPQCFMDVVKNVRIILTTTDLDSDAPFRIDSSLPIENSETSFPVKVPGEPISKSIINRVPNFQSFTFYARSKSLTNIDTVDNAIPFLESPDLYSSSQGDFFVRKSTQEQISLDLHDGRELCAWCVRHLFLFRDGFIPYSSILEKAIKHRNESCPKQELGIPEMVKRSLMRDGWICRQTIIWAKPNPMPESVRDRCTKSHEYIFLLTKSARYFYDHEAVKEPLAEASRSRYAYHFGGVKTATLIAANRQGVGQRTRVLGTREMPSGRNRRSVWTVATRPYKGAHFAVFPPQLIEPCILAGCPVGGTVLDPFAGSGTTGAVALTHDRQFIGIELNPEYLELAKQRIETAKTQPAPKPKRTPKPKAPDLEQRVESLEFRQHGMADNVRRMESAGQMSLFG